LADLARKDRLYFEVGIQELTEYLLSDELYWPVSARGVDLPRLTIGGLLLAQARLHAWHKHMDIASLEDRMGAVRLKWRVAWERKAAREFQARLDLWQNYLSDYRYAPDRHADAYPQEVRWRTMLQLLLDQLPASSSGGASLAGLDRLLETAFLPGKFVWEPQLSSAFSQKEFWFLYGNLRA
jgi:hypothetical protein